MLKRASDEIIKLAEMEQRNVQRNMKRLEMHLPVFDLLMNTASNLSVLLQKALLKEDSALSYTAIMNLYALMMQDALKGMVNFCKGYVTDTSFHTRRAIESAALAIEMYRKPAKVKHYSSFQTEEERVTYVKNFMVFSIVKATLSKDTQKDYALLCFSVHPSALAVGDRASLNEKLEHSMRLVEYPAAAETPRLNMHFLLFVVTMFHAFRDFATAFKDDPDFQWDKADALLKRFDETWQQHAGRLWAANPELLLDNPEL